MVAMTEPLVSTEQLTKLYGRRRALDRVGLQVRQGEVYGFLGPNGAGKTTALRILLGLVRATSGTARVLGRAPGHPRALAHTGMLVETPAFYPYLSGRDNLRVLARYTRTPTARADGVLETVGLAERGRERVSRYSLGMLQRLGVAAALLKDPPLLVLDEPTNGLDPAGMADMRGLIRRLGDEGRTVLLSSHLLDEVQHVCDRVGVIDRGTLLRQATVSELRGRGELRIEATPVAEARKVAERVLGADRVAACDSGLRVDADPGDGTAALVNRELVTAGVTVSAVGRRERSLEEIFFEMTGDARVADVGGEDAG